MEQQTQHYRPTRAVIHLQHIHKNITQLRTFIKPHVAIIAVVKANAYGHGDIEVAQTAIKAGVTMLAVATPDEALHLRSAFPTIDILVLGASPVAFAHVAAEHNITLTVFAQQWLKEVAATNFTKTLKLHIKLDTGMGRIGVTTIEEVKELYQAISIESRFELDGVYTHFATADEEDEDYFMQQVARWHHLLQGVEKKPRYLHVANTATTFMKDEELQLNAVRYGISMYGLSPSSYVKEHLPFPLYPALTLETELVYVKKLLKGQSVGYGATFTAEEDVYIGTLPIGYADGMLRGLSGQDVLIGGKRAPIIGRICMDQCMILLPQAYTIGEKVTLIGTQHEEKITLDDWASKLNTINYEISCILSARVPRVYT